MKQFALIWDIDGTLLSTGGAGVIPFETSFQRVTGRSVKLDRKRFSGFTDFVIAKALLDSVDFEIQTTSHIERILIRFTDLLKKALIENPAKPIGEIVNVLRRLSELANYRCLIGTGNFKPGANAKLESAGLMEFFNVEDIYAATSKFQSRVEILQMAKNAIPEACIGIVIGDSPSDVEAAREVGLKIICTATGQHTRNELMHYGRDLVLTDNWRYEDLEEGIRELISSVA